MCVHTDPHIINYKKTLKKSENSDICKIVVDSLKIYLLHILMILFQALKQDWRLEDKSQSKRANSPTHSKSKNTITIYKYYQMKDERQL